MPNFSGAGLWSSGQDGLKLVIRRFTPIEFWQKVSPHLLRQPSQNNLILGLSHQYKSAPSADMQLLSAFAGETFLGALITTPVPYCNLVVSQTIDAAVAQQLLQAALGSQIDGLVGERQTAQLYAQALQKLGFQVTPLVQQGIYRCRQVKMPSPEARAEFAVASEADISIAAKWIENFRQEAVPHDPQVDTEKLAAERIGKKLIHLLKFEGQPVSMAQFGRDIGTAACINFVYTPPKSRGRGFGSLVTAHLTNKLLLGGRSEISLFTDMANPTANKIYQAIGYEFVCESLHLRVSSRT